MKTAVFKISMFIPALAGAAWVEHWLNKWQPSREPEVHQFFTGKHESPMSLHSQCMLGSLSAPNSCPFVFLFREENQRASPAA